MSNIDLSIATNATGGPTSAQALAIRTSIELGNVTNTADASKPVSTAQQSALDLKAPIASPTLTGHVQLTGQSSQTLNDNSAMTRGLSDMRYLDPYSTNLKSQSFVFEGDSITAGTGTVSAVQTYAYLFSQSPFALGNGTYYNYAVGGAGISTGTGSPSTNNLTDRYTSTVKPKRPTANGGTGGDRSYLLVMCGINEIRGGTIPAATIIANYAAYTTQALADGFTVVISTVLPYDRNQEVIRQTVNKAILNGTIPSSIIFDASSVLPESTNTTYWQSDALHPNGFGNAQLAKGLLSAMYARGYGAGPNSSVIAATTTFRNGLTVSQGLVSDTVQCDSIALTGVKKIDTLKSVTFTPNATGWWRVATSYGLMVGNYRIYEGQFNHSSEGHFHYWDNGDGAISQSNTSINTGKTVTQARVTYGSGASSFDVYVNVANLSTTVEFWGGHTGDSLFSVITPTSGATVSGNSNVVAFDGTKTLIASNGIAAGGITSLAALTLSSTLTLSGTASTPSNVLTPTAWTSVIIGSTTYKLPLYQ